MVTQLENEQALSKATSEYTKEQKRNVFYLFPPLR
jgi:hypothetical protein